MSREVTSGWEEDTGLSSEVVCMDSTNSAEAGRVCRADILRLGQGRGQDDPARRSQGRGHPPSSPVLPLVRSPRCSPWGGRAARGLLQVKGSSKGSSREDVGEIGNNPVHLAAFPKPLLCGALTPLHPGWTWSDLERDVESGLPGSSRTGRLSPFLHKPAFPPAVLSIPSPSSDAASCRKPPGRSAGGVCPLL